MKFTVILQLRYVKIRDMILPVKNIPTLLCVVIQNNNVIGLLIALLEKIVILPNKKEGVNHEGTHHKNNTGRQKVKSKVKSNTLKEIQGSLTLIEQ